MALTLLKNTQPSLEISQIDDPPSVGKILVIDDSQMVQRVLEQLLRANIHADIQFASSFAQVKDLVGNEQQGYFIAVTNLNLSDAMNGEVAEFLIANGIPTIVLTASFDTKKRNYILDAGVVDYVLKDSQHSYDYTVRLIQQIHKNKDIKVLLVEDSKSERLYTKALLQRQLFQVLEAANGIEALEVLSRHPDVRLVITDYNMPEMDGIELIKKVRANFNKENIVIIGLSGDSNSNLSAKFIKSGADDFLNKPFLYEELQCRVMRNIEEQEMFLRLQDIANRDFLTKLYNRRYFMEEGKKLYNDAGRQNANIALAMLDIDHFKSVNDNHGHDCGDAVLREFATLMNTTLPEYLVARLGGEEFAILMPDCSLEMAKRKLDEFRKVKENTVTKFDDTEIPATCSIGVTSKLYDSFDAMLKAADECLYEAKKTGRNRVVDDIN